jgi:hypothetical protein
LPAKRKCGRARRLRGDVSPGSAVDRNGPGKRPAPHPRSGRRCDASRTTCQVARSHPPPRRTWTKGEGRTVIPRRKVRNGGRQNDLSKKAILACGSNTATTSRRRSFDGDSPRAKGVSREQQTAGRSTETPGPRPPHGRVRAEKGEIDARRYIENVECRPGLWIHCS